VSVPAFIRPALELNALELVAALALLAGALLAALLADELDGAGADELVEADLLLLHAVMTRAAATV